jgi:hypothetical protein
MKKIRTALGVLGGIGVFAWPTLGFIAWLFHDWKPGGAQGGLSAFQVWFCALSLMAVSAYYIAVAASQWSRWLFVTGAALHTALLISLVILISSTDGGFLIAPVILVGPVIWFIYAIRIRESKPAA